MARMEAMAAGRPVLSNRHPTCPIEHGVSGFASDDPDLAYRMGQAARRTAETRFAKHEFVPGMRAAITKA